MVQIFHNPRCSKSRQTLALLEEKGVEAEIITYLEAAPSVDDIKNLIKALGIETARDMMRKGEAIYKELGLKNVEDEDALVAAMAEHPILIERPIVVNGDKARIGRPPESVLEIL